MTRPTRGRARAAAAAATVVAAATAAALLPAGTAAAQPPDAAGEPVPTDRRFAAAPELPNPLGDKQEAQRQQASQELVSGQLQPRTRGGSEVVRLADGEYVEVATTGTDRIFTILVEFGDEVHPEYGGTPGPAHNEIAEPDRSENNTTIWQEDFDRQYYEDVYYSEDADTPSVRQYYENQSSGQYTVDGTVSDWVRVDYNEARYGSNHCGSSVCRSVWDVVSDGVTAWYEDQLASGLTPEEVGSLLAEYDAQDRYDFDGDGDFSEPDGYLDHFQLVHAGEDESAGGGAQGADAIWAHRWYAYADRIGAAGPEYNPAGGTQIADTGLWVGDYTIQPENGGVGVFAHEFGHDIGLPDLYDTAGGENGTGFWSAMSSGSWLGTGEQTIGELPNDLGSWEKLQLGWLDYDVAQAATRSSHRLAPAGAADSGRAADAVIVELPERTVTTQVHEPAEGESQWWSGSGNDLNNTMTTAVDLSGATTASLDLTAWWSIEEDYDFLYPEISTDGGQTWSALEGTADGQPLPRDSAGRTVLTGESLEHAALSFPLDAYAGQPVELRFRYQTDGSVAHTGFTADAITVTADGETVFADDAESGGDAWQTDGFRTVGAAFTESYPQFYIVENRQYTGFDATLENGPYNFGWLDSRPSWVEHLSYGTGMLVWLWDTSHTDNNTSEHPGGGLILPVDAHAEADLWSNGTPMRNRLQTRDSAFSRDRVPAITLHRNGEPTTLPAHRGSPVFDDRRGDYYDEDNPMGSVVVPDTNTRISILSEPRSSSRPMTVQVAPSQR